MYIQKEKLSQPKRKHLQNITKKTFSNQNSYQIYHAQIKPIPISPKSLTTTSKPASPSTTASMINYAHVLNLQSYHSNLQQQIKCLTLQHQRDRAQYRLEEEAMVEAYTKLSEVYQDLKQEAMKYDREYWRELGRRDELEGRNLGAVRELTQSVEGKDGVGKVAAQLRLANMQTNNQIKQIQQLLNSQKSTTQTTHSQLNLLRSQSQTCRTAIQSLKEKNKSLEERISNKNKQTQLLRKKIETIIQSISGKGKDRDGKFRELQFLEGRMNVFGQSLGDIQCRIEGVQQLLTQQQQKYKQATKQQTRLAHTVTTLITTLDHQQQYLHRETKQIQDMQERNKQDRAGLQALYGYLEELVYCNELLSGCRGWESSRNTNRNGGRKCSPKREVVPQPFQAHDVILQGNTYDQSSKNSKPTSPTIHKHSSKKNMSEKLTQYMCKRQKFYQYQLQQVQRSQKLKEQYQHNYKESRKNKENSQSQINRKYRRCLLQEFYRKGNSTEFNQKDKQICSSKIDTHLSKQPQNQAVKSHNKSYIDNALDLNIDLLKYNQQKVGKVVLGVESKIVLSGNDQQNIEHSIKNKPQSYRLPKQIQAIIQKHNKQNIQNSLATTTSQLEINKKSQENRHQNKNKVSRLNDVNQLCYTNPNHAGFSITFEDKSMHPKAGGQRQSFRLDRTLLSDKIKCIQGIQSCFRSR